METSGRPGKLERLIRSPWFWLVLIVVACELSSLVQGSGFILRPEHFWLMICYAFVFVLQLPEAFDLPTVKSGTFHFLFAVVGCFLYLAFALSARLLPSRLLHRVALGGLVTVWLMTGGCTAWVMSWHR